ncbi:hypothetical protein [Nocardioides luteus]|uniref:Uncharacterized protein n=1 Tax=Nocardioides luteus TaxID=1844 RepID=A0A1J4NAG7_9ACTN|nr:hypothetical protein [Nocardioides luteus]OIJ28548.1 hypothetical protein UG56_001845 [Nocardioides luteus]
MNETLVNTIKEVLTDAKVEIDKVHVDKPASKALGGGATAATLESLMNRATDRINSAMSQTSNALIKFVDGLDDAVRAVKDADEEAEEAFKKDMMLAVEMIDQPFFDNLTKDDRPNMPGFQLPFFPLSPEALQEIVSRSEFGQDQED